MTYSMGDYVFAVQGDVTNISFVTTADYAYRQYLAKKKMIADLEYECELLVDKYHAELRQRGRDVKYILSLRNGQNEDIGTFRGCGEVARRIGLTKQCARKPTPFRGGRNRAK